MFKFICYRIPVFYRYSTDGGSVPICFLVACCYSQTPVSGEIKMVAKSLHPEATEQSMTKGVALDQEIVALVQDWLSRSSLTETSRCLVEECEQRGQPPDDQLQDLVSDRLAALRALMGANRQNCSSPESGRDGSVLELLVAYAFSERERALKEQHQLQQQSQPQTVLISSKRLAIAPVQFASKRVLSNSSAPTLQGLSPPTAKSHADLATMRPKSAVICKSTSDLLSRTPLQSAASLSSPPSTLDQQTRRSKRRPISAASVLTPNRDAISEKARPASTSQSGLAAPVSFVSSRRKTRPSLGNLQSLALIHEANVKDPSDSDSDAKQNPTDQLAQDFEQMTEAALSTQFTSLSKGAIKRVRRVLAKSNACTQEFEKCRLTLDKIHTRAKQRERRQVLVAEHTLLLSSSMDTLTKEACSLCLHVFAKKNLTMRVSYKSIYDLRDMWKRRGGGAKSNNNDSSSDLLALDDGHECCADEDDEDTTHTGMDSVPEELGRIQRARLYDQVPVCAFCSQLVLDFGSYRVRACVLSFRVAWLTPTRSCVCCVAVVSAAPGQAQECAVAQERA